MGLMGHIAFAQEVIVTDSTAIHEEPQIAAVTVDTSATFERFKIDGVAAVVGDFVILESDVDKMYINIRSQGGSLEGVTACNLMGRLMENKLYAHHAIQDSIVVADSQINASIDQQLAYMMQELGTMEKVIEFYGKENEEELRTLLFEINKQNMLAQKMRQQIVEAVEITPEEVRDFFTEIPEDEIPMFGTEVEIAQIVIEPEIPESEKKEIIARLNSFREDVLENGASFATKAVLYSDDQGTRSSGGQITMSRKDPFVEEFKEVAFSLEEGEVSEPFRTEFGYHILTVDKIRGQQVDVRHILLIPDVNDKTVAAAKKKIDSIRAEIINGNLEFTTAARMFSDEEETSGTGGKLINPTTGDTQFELTKLSPSLYQQVNELEEGEVSLVLTEKDRTGRPQFKILKVTQRTPEHIANYANDYNKIKELALRDKQLEVIQEWQTEKIGETYIKINGDYRDCDYNSDWQKE